MKKAADLLNKDTKEEEECVFLIRVSHLRRRRGVNTIDCLLASWSLLALNQLP